MPRDRSAINTIKGYYYQFDYYILKLLEQLNDIDTVCIEGIEDVDIFSDDETTAIQCKYYAGTEYNHSLLVKPICFMLDDYKERRSSGKPIRYKIYGYHKSGQDKLCRDYDLSFAQKHFFTFEEKGKECKYHIKLGLVDADLNDFLSNLTIDINAPSFEEQEQKILEIVRIFFSCSKFEAEYYYYNAALGVIRNLAIESNIANRTINKRDFISRINRKDILFNTWFIAKKGAKKYYKELKKTILLIIQYISL